MESKVKYRSGNVTFMDCPICDGKGKIANGSSRFHGQKWKNCPTCQGNCIVAVAPAKNGSEFCFSKRI